MVDLIPLAKDIFSLIGYLAVLIIYAFTLTVSQNDSYLGAGFGRLRIDSTTCSTKLVTARSDRDQEQEDGSKYPDKLKLAFVVFALNISMFCVGLDNTILSAAIPKITDQFHALDDVGWYASSYLLTTCSFQLMWGKLFTFYPIKWTYLVALFIFELGSLICGVAPTSTALIIGRAIAGVGSSGVGSGAFLLVAYSVPPRQRPTLVGMIGGMYGFASIAGPLMGGAFTDNEKLTWRWCFYINLPLGLVTTIFIVLFAPAPGGNKSNTVSFMDQLKQIDLPGTTVMLPGVICLLLALQWGGTKYEWKDGRIITLLVLAGVLLIGFIVIQIRSGERATVPPRVFGNRNIWGSAVFGACVTGCFFLMLYYIPIWFQAIKGASAIKSGLMNLPMVLSFVIFSFLGGSLTSVTGHYVQFAYLTVAFMAVGTGLLTTLEVDSSYPEWIGYQVLFGAGVGFGLQTALTAPQTALSLQDVPIGTATIMFSENLTAAIMVSVAQNVFTNQLMKNMSTYVSTMDPRIILTVGATQIKSQVGQEFYDAVLIAYNKSLTQTFYVGVALSCCSVFGVVWLQWLSVKGKKIDTAHAA
ncbi:putative MFS transporter [Zopfia rhizophila CBS 207.26]|uniref:Putative MFS transporter n=1 Tax=Zopfia rhizophila CBS 207.26 TaxID=1314779 RepID=A0A6A6EKT4_9PEZI|nr:putative MFS transporter [Zopfia rhizophila CBS 207.26]